MSDMQELKSGGFESEVLKSTMPTVVDFYAEWCGPCNIIFPVIEKLSEEYKGRAKFVKLDTDKNSDIAMRYGIMSIPTILIFKGGQVMTTIIGTAAASVFKKKIDAVI